MKPVFKLEDYPGKVVMHCPEKWMAEKFCRFLNDAGRKWWNEGKYNSELWEETGKKTCFNFKDGVYADIKYYERRGYIILEFTDFDWDDTPDTTHTLTEALINEHFSRLLSDCPCAETPAEAARELEAVFTAWAGALDEFREVNKNA